MIVDAHTHVWRATTEFPNPSATIVSPLSDIPIELLSGYMDEFGVDRAVLVQPIYPAEDNSLVADCATTEPDRFAAVCVVDPNTPDAADKLEYWVSERGCRGLRLRPAVPAEEAAFGAVSSFPIWECAAQLGIVINVLARQRHMPALDSLGERFPTVPVIVDHMAHPDVSAGVGSAEFQTLLGLARHENVYVKPTGYCYYSGQAYPYRDCGEFFRALYDRFGPRRLVWGSDFPHVLLKCGYNRMLKLQEREFTFLTDDELALIMGGNAMRLYWNDA